VPTERGTGLWAYAITVQERLTGRDGPVDLSWLPGIGGARVRVVTCQGLAVLVSDASLAEFGADALRENLEDLQWLDEFARQHHDVIDAAARLFPLLPVRLATVYTGEDAARAALAEQREELLATLRRVGGHVEWGVKAYAAAVAAQAGQAGAGQAGAEDGSGTGLAYLKRRRDQLAAGREARASAADGARALHEDLAGKATAAVVRPPQSTQLSGIREPMLLNAAYLLNADGGRDFTAAVAAGATTHPELRVDLTGPWPPYSFTGGQG
jgi:hypothetical protein